MDSRKVLFSLFNGLILLALLAGAVSPVAAQEPELVQLAEPVINSEQAFSIRSPDQPSAPEAVNYALQFNGTNQYVTFNKGHHLSGTLGGSPGFITGGNQKLGNYALRFNGTNQYVTYGITPTLGLKAFTLEIWFKRTATGATTSTGTGGCTSAVPLLTKGRGEADGSNLDMNYFLGIDSTNNKICADFEDLATGLNHPIWSPNAIANNIWYHTAVTYDGSAWAMYVNGVVTSTLTVNQTPRYDSIQHAGLATAMTSNGTRAGYFAGDLDEVRIWNYARSVSDISGSLNTQITIASGLIARYGMEEGSGTKITDTSNSGLGVTSFTIETWFNRTGAGAYTTTGTGGVNAIPLVTKGRGEADGDNRDMNYFLGISNSGGMLVADFEDNAGGANHPITGTTTILNNTWYHAAATYDGATWRLYLNGVQEATLLVNRTPRSDSIQHAALATALTSTGSVGSAPIGYFQGKMDEARVWGVARTRDEITTTMYSQITTSVTNLLARWGMDENARLVVGAVGPWNINGSMVNNPTWTSGPVFTPPSAPSNLQACAMSSNTLCLNWTDNSGDEQNFVLERSDDDGGSWNFLATLAANSVSYKDTTGLNPNTPYCYRLKAVNTRGDSAYSNTACATSLPIGQSSSGLLFGGADYVNLGVEPANVTNFTVETWFNWTGGGTGTTTGTGGIPNAIPIVAKGAQQAEGTNVDMNFFLGLEQSTGKLVGDFEEGSGGPGPLGQNHPVYGATPVTTNAWHHAALTYDSASAIWKVYLDGRLDATLDLGSNIPPRADNVQPGGIATSLNLTNGTNGFFQGMIDEVRVWSVVRSQEQIQTGINQEVLSAANLVWHYGLNEAAGTTASSSTGAPSTAGNIIGTGWSWWCNAPFNLNFAPLQPTSLLPSDLATSVPTWPKLQVNAFDGNNDNMTVNFYGRPASAVGTDFTIIAFPDPQYYASTYPDTYTDQTQWIADHKVVSNTVFVAGLGDNVDSASEITQWNNADAAYSILENENIPFGLELGNHDGAPSNTATFNSYFGISRFGSLPWYGGHYGSDNDNHYDLFEASGLKFIAIFIEYDDGMTTTAHPVLAWANNQLQTYSDRRGIVISHNLLQGGASTAWSTEGQTIYEALKGNPNLDLMLGGHLDVAGRRTENYNGNTTYVMRSDYQFVDGNNSGYLRALRFSPVNNKIYVTTYSPTQDKYYPTDVVNNQFELDYPMDGSGAYTLLGSVPAASGSNASLVWQGLNYLSDYQWYVTLSDGVNTTTSPVWSFTTADVPTTVYADDNFSLGATESFGYDRFASIQAGINTVASGGAVAVADGDYHPEVNETVTLDKHAAVTLTGNVRLNGSLEILNGSFTATPLEFMLTGDLTLGGAGTFTHNNGKVIFEGSGPQSLNTATITFYDLEINPGVTLTTLGDVTVSHETTNHGVTHEERTLSGTASQSFGLAGVTLELADNTCIGGLGLTMERRDTDHPGAAKPAMQTGRWWDITPACIDGSFTASLTMPHANLNDPKVCKFTGEAGDGYDCAADPGATTTTVTRSGISEFSEWTVGQHVGPTALRLTALRAASRAQRLPIILGLALFAISALVVFERRLRK